MVPYVSRQRGCHPTEAYSHVRTKKNSHHAALYASPDTHIANGGSEAEDMSIQTAPQMNDVALRPDSIKKTNRYRDIQIYYYQVPIIQTLVNHQPQSVLDIRVLHNAKVCKAHTPTSIAEEKAQCVQSWLEIFHPIKVQLKCFHHLAQRNMKNQVERTTPFIMSDNFLRK